MSSFRIPKRVAVLALLASCGTTDRTPFSAARTAPPDGAAASIDPTLVSADGSTSSAAQGPCAPSPTNFDVPGNGCDDDANGVVDDVVACDTSLPIDGDAAAFGRSIGLCQTATPERWGVVSARYTNGYASDLPPASGQHGILPKFGAVIGPREGAAF